MLTRQAFEVDAFPDRSGGAEEISADPDLAELMRRYFLVPEGKDECAFHMSLFRMLHALLIKRGVVGYTILPTLCVPA